MKTMEDKRNFLIPNHRKLAEDETKQILKKYELVAVTKLPKIKVNDPGLAGLDCKISDVVEITRNSFAGESKYYRVVVE